MIKYIFSKCDDISRWPCDDKIHVFKLRWYFRWFCDDISRHCAMIKLRWYYPSPKILLKKEKKCYVTLSLWLTPPLPQVLFGDTVTTHPTPWSVTYFFCERISAQKVLVKCWWNWHLVGKHCSNIYDARYKTEINWFLKRIECSCKTVNEMAGKPHYSWSFYQQICFFTFEKLV